MNRDFVYQMFLLNKFRLPICGYAQENASRSTHPLYSKLCDYIITEGVYVVYTLEAIEKIEYDSYYPSIGYF